ncbi:MAG: AraC family transcriptional regulator, partial [Bacteroidota bacterium]
LETENGEPTEVVIIRFFPDTLKIVYGNDVPDVFKSSSLANVGPVEKTMPGPVLQNFLDGLRFYLDHPEMITEEFLKIKIRELIHILLQSQERDRMRAIFSDLFRSNAYEFKEIIHSHLFEDLKIQDLAFFTGLSLSSFKRKFKNVFGTSPAQYIKTKRLEKAENLLKTTEERISDIAYDCGFSDIAYFSRSFSAIYQLSPSNYRKQYLDEISN